MRITIDDVRALHCTRGAKRWFEQHGLDFRTFLREGIDAETFLATGDQRAEAVVRHKLLALNDPKANQVVMAKLREEPPHGR